MIYRAAIALLQGAPSLAPEYAVTIARQTLAAVDQSPAEQLVWLPAICPRCLQDYGSAGWSFCPQCDPAF